MNKFKTLTEVKEAVDAGKKVWWKNQSYQLSKASNGSDYMITHIAGNIVYLTNSYKPEDFFTQD
jgi:hypothetical protein